MSTITSVAPSGVLSNADVTADIDVVNKPTTDGTSDATSTDHSTEQPTETTAVMAEHFYRYKVQMTCGGCSGAVNRVLKKAQDSGEGVTSYTVSLETQSVEVRGPIEFDLLTSKIEKTGKKILDKEEVGETPSEVPAPPEVEPIVQQPVAVA